MVADWRAFEFLPGNQNNTIITDIWRCTFFTIFDTLVAKANRPMVAPEILRMYGGPADMGFQMVTGSSKFGIVLKHPEWRFLGGDNWTDYFNPGNGAVGHNPPSFNNYEFPSFFCTYEDGVGGAERVISPVYQVADARRLRGTPGPCVGAHYPG